MSGTGHRRRPIKYLLKYELFPPRGIFMRIFIHIRLASDNDNIQTSVKMHVG